MTDTGVIRQFDTGATRDTTQGKPEPAGFESSAVIARYAEYMQKHRVQADGNLRQSDNWKKGMPRDVYMHSMFRHFLDVWSLWEMTQDPNWDDEMNPVHVESLEESLCALRFNVQGMLYEVLRGRDVGRIS
jgi:hypothetical protein